MKSSLSPSGDGTDRANYQDMVEISIGGPCLDLYAMVLFGGAADPPKALLGKAPFAFLRSCFSEKLTMFVWGSF